MTDSTREKAREVIAKFIVGGRWDANDGRWQDEGYDDADAILAALAEAGLVIEENIPNHCYDKYNWEMSYPWDIRDELLDDYHCHEIVEIGCLRDCPSQFAVQLIDAWDDEGGADGWTWKWYGTRKEAEQAVAANVPPTAPAESAPDG